MSTRIIRILKIILDKFVSQNCWEQAKTRYKYMKMGHLHMSVLENTEKEIALLNMIRQTIKILIKVT
ncbi:hypothetical protein I79_016199 [Cricetulus griseus]|uniref:Uncharacterized protein n=1 Tax=Cricetulus griseus TaxID=10029 RepID=G3HYQ8_CRIGR|nr:hypothetical protein I79_016199 [Cricetulus griseus]